ncbi:hypothetical protein SAMN04488523_10748 [Sulfitobacter brevis]|uniref:Uncharacterized protein n=1 Tax=Sulfitobacter brevis TaxID=74348 RepID=A0A1I2AE58_9RHOB|nr:hypothetical protein SAMN04488523_10748 [Sulfitobacter brevis]
MDGSNISSPRQRRNAVADFMPRRIKRVSRSLGYCLLLWSRTQLVLARW